jgi:hypothetical protein
MLEPTDTSRRTTVPLSTFETNILAWSKSSSIAKSQGPVTFVYLSTGVPRTVCLVVGIFQRKFVRWGIKSIANGLYIKTGQAYTTRSRVYGSTFSEWFPKRRASTGKSRQEAYGSIGSTSASTSNCRPASAMGTEALLEKIFSASGTCCGATMLLQPQPQSWNFHRTSDSHPYSGILRPSLTTVLGITTDRIDMLIMLGRYWRHRCWARGHWWYY